MSGKFLLGKDVPTDSEHWGQMGWISRPQETQSKHLTEILVVLEPGCGHDFHLHPRQEEIIYVLEGEIEQYLETDKRILRKGDAVFIGVGTVHGSFNVAGQTARLLLVLAPSVTEAGYELVDVSGEAPWNGLRK